MKKLFVILTLIIFSSVAFADEKAAFGNPRNKYWVAGFDNDAKVDDFAKRFKEAVLAGDKRQVSEMLRYPVMTNLKDGSELEIASSDEMMERFNEVFYPVFLEALNKAVPNDMFSNAEGVMLSSDENVFWIWFCPLGDKGQTIVVTSIFSDMNIVANSLKELAEK